MKLPSLLEETKKIWTVEKIMDVWTSPLLILKNHKTIQRYNDSLLFYFMILSISSTRYSKKSFALSWISWLWEMNLSGWNLREYFLKFFFTLFLALFDILGIVSSNNSSIEKFSSSFSPKIWRKYGECWKRGEGDNLFKKQK